MVYLAGIVGFIGGFVVGQMFLSFLLRKYTNEELKNDKTLRIYGFLNWLIAGLGATAMVVMYKQYFGH